MIFPYPLLLKRLYSHGIPPIVFMNSTFEFVSYLVKLSHFYQVLPFFLAGSMLMYIYTQSILKNGDYCNLSNDGSINIIFYSFKASESILNRKILTV